MRHTVRKFLISITLAFALAGCAVNSPNNPITMSRMATAEDIYKVANDGAAAYRSLRQCRKTEVSISANPCRRYSTTLAIQQASVRVNQAFVLGRKCVRDSTSNTDCVAGIEAAVAAYSVTVATVRGN